LRKQKNLKKDPEVLRTILFSKLTVAFRNQRPITKSKDQNLWIFSEEVYFTIKGRKICR